MIGRLIKLIFSLAFLAACLVVIMAGWVICDGLMDQLDHADVAVVPGHGEVMDGAANDALKARLDRAIQLYQQHVFPVVVVCGGGAPDGSDEAGIMGQYLMDHGMPASAIVEDHQGAAPEQAAHHVADFMQTRAIDSVLVLAPYYRVTRLKFALKHAKITKLSQVHTGKLEKSDAEPIVREAVAIYYYMSKYYLFPAAKVVAQQLEDQAEKMKSQAADKMNSIDK